MLSFAQCISYLLCAVIRGFQFGLRVPWFLVVVLHYLCLGMQVVMNVFVRLGGGVLSETPVSHQCPASMSSEPPQGQNLISQASWLRVSKGRQQAGRWCQWKTSKGWTSQGSSEHLGKAILDSRMIWWFPCMVEVGDLAIFPIFQIACLRF